MTLPKIDYQDLKMFSCAECGHDTLARGHAVYWGRLTPEQKATTGIYGGRINGRPFCSRCMKPSRSSCPQGGRRGVPVDGTGASHDNALRAYEEDR